VAFATNKAHRERIAKLGFEVHSIRPDVGPDDPEMMAYLLDLNRGPERLVREVVFPALRGQYEDLERVTRGADLLMAGELVHAAPILAEKTGIAWATHVLAPLSFFSAYDPPVVPPYPALAHLYRFGPAAGRALAWFGRIVTRSWIGPVVELREELGLPPGRHPIFEGKFSPQLVLAMFSPLVGAPQPDWPPNTEQTGFTFYDGTDAPLARDVEDFLAAGEPPVVFTLGSSAVLDPGQFFDESAAAAERLGMRALLIGGGKASTGRVHVAPYAPYSAVFARARVIVHQGGIGTTAQALRAGKPMVVVPYGFDQPDNAARVRRLGVAETIARKKYDARRAVEALRRVTDYAKRAAMLAEQIRAEDGACGAADAVERLMARGRARSS
jgi:UDP:flavonoid glycosyltransferase YjiC (YdhE family)